MAVEIHPPEYDPVVYGRRFEGHVHGIPGVEGIAFNGDLTQEGTLLHGCRGSVGNLL